MFYAPTDEPEESYLALGPERSGLKAHGTGPAGLVAPPVEGGGREWLLQVWGEAREAARTEPAGAVLAIDEIQKIGNWPETVKGLWDRDRRDGLPLHVVLLGSTPLLAQRGLTESLAGRFERIHVPHWSFTEMSRAFNLNVDQYLYYGGYPGAMRFRGTEDRWRAHVLEAIIAPAIERDVIALDRVDRPELLRCLFELAAGHSAQILTLRGALKMLAEGGHPGTVARYLDLLENAGLVASLRGYARYAGRRIDSHAKLNVLDTALMTAVSGRSFDEARNPGGFRGRLVETAVGAHLYNTRAPGDRLHYWQDRDGREVDFVLERGGKLVGCEVKSGPHPRPRSGLREFARRFDGTTPLVVGEGGISLDEFLSTPASERFPGP